MHHAQHSRPLQRKGKNIGPQTNLILLHLNHFFSASFLDNGTQFQPVHQS
jgi:hypothetical protein